MFLEIENQRVLELPGTVQPKKEISMQIKFVEIQNFRKLKSVRIELAEETTLLVGANNSGKTSAMEALVLFLVDQSSFTTNDFTVSNWTKIDGIGNEWEKAEAKPGSQSLIMIEWEDVLPSLDVWLKVEKNEVHHIIRLLPTLGWNNESLLGVRLRLEPKNIEELYKDYVTTWKAAKGTVMEAENKNGEEKFTVTLWPTSMSDYLKKRLASKFEVRSYLLDPKKLKDSDNMQAYPQSLPVASEHINENPFKGLIRIDKIIAQRGFSDVSADTDDGSNYEGYDKRRLSSQLGSYYKKHIDPHEMPQPSDVKALEAIHQAQEQFDVRLEDGFSTLFNELKELGYPGVTDPKPIISTNIKPMDALKHSSALQYEVASHKSKTSSMPPPRLPEQYNGLGYQNLISMVFRLMSFRDGWMKVGKEGKKAEAEASEGFFIPPLHLVLVEEPEAHLHAQVQQVFIRKAYSILRKHNDLGKKTILTTQLVVSTHSSHIAHECKFAWLRYFRRLPSIKAGDVPSSTVVNLSRVFDEEENANQKFVTRYLKTTHCDLFFADAAILVEGPAERMLVPNFIHIHFKKLNQSYITLLEIGGSHAHRLLPLIEHLGLLTLVITDLDATNKTDMTSIQPMRGCEQVTRNATLKTWWPKKEQVDELLGTSMEDKVKQCDNFCSVRVAYQCPVTVPFGGDGAKDEVLSNTFEDALVFENLSIFKNLEGDGLIKKFKDAIAESKTPKDLGKTMLEILKKGNKAEFALELLYSKEPEKFKVPTYINEGLTWLQDQLERKQLEDLTLSGIPQSAAKGANA